MITSQCDGCSGCSYGTCKVEEELMAILRNETQKTEKQQTLNEILDLKKDLEDTIKNKLTQFYKTTGLFPRKINISVAETTCSSSPRPLFNIMGINLEILL